MKKIIGSFAEVIIAFGIVIHLAEPLLGFLFSKSDDHEKLYKENRQRSLDCSCGVTGSRDPSLPLPWHVLIKFRETDTRSARHSSTLSVPQHKYCSGTIINNRIIVTSVSCVLYLSVPEISGDPVRGIVYQYECVLHPEELNVTLLSDGRVLGVQDIWYHPKFLYYLGVHGKMDYDIALLALTEELKFTNDEMSPVPVCIPRHILTSEKLEGLEVLYSQLMSGLEIENRTTPAHKENFTRDSHTSYTYPLMRCRVNSETTWLSDRFLCSEADPFKAKLDTEIGTALITKNEGAHAQIGVISWKTYFPLLNNKKPLMLATNIANFLQKIDDYSADHQAQWCMNEWHGLPKERWQSGSESDINFEAKSSDEEEPWLGMSSKFRNIRGDCFCGRENSNAKGRIQGGKEAKKYEYGWMAQLLSTIDGTTQLCGGSIVNSRVILTAAHCVYKQDERGELGEKVLPKNMEVRVGRHGGPNEKDENSQVLKVKAVIAHPKYSTQYVDNDVALLILRKPIQFHKLIGKIAPICFPMTNESLEIDDRPDAKIIGWGRTEALKKGTHASKLQELVVKVASRQECLSILSQYQKKAKAYRRVMSDGKKLCAGTFSKPRDYNDPAQGDSGGPLFMPIVPGSRTMIQIGTASMITLTDDEKLQNVQTVTLYARSVEQSNVLKL